MKYLISFDTNVIVATQAKEWGVDRVLTLGDDITPDLMKLPDDNDSLTFFIPTVLDYNNSLSYQGATLSLRILMSYIRRKRTDIDIVLLGNETESSFLLHYDYPNILKIPGVHYIRFNRKVVASYKLPKREWIDKIEYKQYLDNLGLRLPSSFKSTHSLTNEWCLFKWNSFMGFDANSSSLIGHLYFEYLITIESLAKVGDKKITERIRNRLKYISSTQESATRILIIDDNIEWHTFFDNLFKENANVKIQCLGENFNKLEYSDISRLIEDRIVMFNPHIIILDFRLMEDKDAEIKDDMKQISGYKVLTEILKGTYSNPTPSFGRQVLIFTATSRIENVLMLREGNADEFILKEKPENYNGKEITKHVISKMISTIETAISRADFLIPLNEKLDQLIRLSKNASQVGFNLSGSIQNTSQIVRQFTQKNELEVDVLKSIFLNIFNVFEELKRDTHFVDYSNNFALIIKGKNNLVISGKSKCAMSSNSDDDWNYKPIFTPSSRHEKFCKDRSLNFAICALILFRLGMNEVDDTDWNIIRLIRNAIAHGEDEKLSQRGLSLNKSTLKSYIIKMMDLLINIIDKNNINEVNPIL